MIQYEAGFDATIDPKVALDEAAEWHIPFYSNSLFYPANNLLTNASTLSFTQYTYNGTSADVNWYVLWDIFGGKNSAIAAVPQNATAYNARDMLMNLQVCQPLAIDVDHDASSTGGRVCRSWDIV